MANTALLRLAALLLLSLMTVSSAENLCFNKTFECIPKSCPTNCKSSMFECFLDEDDNELKCDHVDLFEGDIGRDIGVIIVIVVFLMLASVGGIGGGGIVVPMLLIIGEFPSYYGVPLSVTAIVGGAIVLFLMQIGQHHPNPEVKHRPLIDFDIMILLLPTALAGTVIGVIINSVSPNWFVLAIIFIVLSFTTFKTLFKGRSLARIEKAQREEQRAHVDSETGSVLDRTHEISVNGHAHEKKESIGMKEYCSDSGIVDGEDQQKAPPSLKDVLQSERCNNIIDDEAKFPWKFLVVTFSELAGLIILNILRGGSGGSVVGVQCNSGAYWGLTAATFGFLLTCSVIGAFWVKRRYDRKVAAGYKFVEGDVHFSGPAIIRYPVYAFFVGLLAGFLGIGGGMVLGPLLLQMNMVPLVSSATTAFMNLFTSSSSTVQYLVLGRIPWDYGLILFFSSMVASALSQLLVGYVRRSGRNSLLVFTLAFVIGVATIMLVVSGSLQVKEDADQGKSFGFRDLCD